MMEYVRQATYKEKTFNSQFWWLKQVPVSAQLWRGPRGGWWERGPCLRQEATKKQEEPDLLTFKFIY